MLEPDGEIYGVELIDPPRNRGDERWIWAALAPFVVAGGEMIWFGEDDRLVRWTFDGNAMKEGIGHIVFEEAHPVETVNRSE
jgi:hypothetical protein